MIFGMVGMLTAQRLNRVVAFSIILSSGTVLAACALGPESLTAPALFYMSSSVFASGAFFLLTGIADRIGTQASQLADTATLAEATYSGFGLEDPPDAPAPDEEVGVAIPTVMAFLGLAFVCCALLVAGLPPLSGFMAKFAILSSAIAIASAGDSSVQTWALVAILLAAGLVGIIAFTRIGIRIFWSATVQTPRVRIIEAAPVAVLLVMCVGLTVAAGPAMKYLDATAAALHTPRTYIDAVLPSSRELIAKKEPAP